MPTLNSISDTAAAAYQQAKNASLYNWITAGVFCLRAMDGSWMEYPLSTACQLLAVGAVSSTVEFFSGKEELSKAKAKKVVTGQLKSAAAGSAVGGALALTSLGVLGTAAPIGAEATNGWVTDWLSSNAQTLIELETYDYYRNLAWLTSFVPSVQAVYVKMRNAKARTKGGHAYDGCSVELAKDIGKLLGLALGRTLLAAGINGAMNSVLKKGHSDRPIKYNTERTSPATDPVRQESQGKWQSKNTFNGVKSCTLSKEENWPSGHSSTTMLASWEAENNWLKAVLALPGLATMVGRVLADCHTPSAVIAGMLLAGLSVEAADVIVDRLIHKCVAPAHQDGLRAGLVANAGRSEVDAEMLKAIEEGNFDPKDLTRKQREALAKLCAEKDTALGTISAM